MVLKLVVTIFLFFTHHCCRHLDSPFDGRSASHPPFNYWHDEDDGLGEAVVGAMEWISWKECPLCWWMKVKKERRMISIFWLEEWNGSWENSNVWRIRDQVMGADSHPMRLLQQNFTWRWLPIVSWWFPAIFINQTGIIIVTTLSTDHHHFYKQEGLRGRRCAGGEEGQTWDATQEDDKKDEFLWKKHSLIESERCLL